jgi:hypothetical protein
MEKYLKKFRKQENGQAIILIVFVMAALLGGVSLAVDVGRVTAEKADMQNAVDFAVLGAARVLPNSSQAISIADEIMNKSGYTDDMFEIVTPYNGDINKIEVKLKNTVELLFADVFNVTESNVSTRAMAGRMVEGGVFDYAVFSGSEIQDLLFNGSTLLVDGNVHGNDKVKINGSYITVTGRVEAAGDVVITGSNQNVGDEVPNYNYIDMPVWDLDVLRGLATHVYTGDQDFDTGDLDVNGLIFVDGNVVIDSHTVGTGSLIATGDITFNGSDQTFRNDHDEVTLYSLGDIKFNGSDADFRGIMYAPFGKITLNGSHQYIEGSIVGLDVTLNGSGQTIDYDPEVVNNIPIKQYSVQLYE